MLIDSYMRRQSWLQRSQAVQVLNAYAEAMGGGKSEAPPSRAPVAAQPDDDIFALSIKATQ